MIEKKYIKALTMFEGIKGIVIYYIMVFAPIFLLIMTILNFYLASKIGMKEGYDLISLFKSWEAGIEASKQYSGIYLMAIERLEMAILLFGVTLIWGIAAVKVRVTRQRNRRIVEILKRHEEWPEL